MMQDPHRRPMTPEPQGPPMALDPDELAIRHAFARRRPASVPPELAERVAAVPREVKPFRPLPVRLALGIAPWAAVAAVFVALVLGPRLLVGTPGPGTGGPTTGATWTPANPGGGFATVDVFGLPWVPLLPVAAAWGVIATVRRTRSGRGLRPGRDELRRWFLGAPVQARASNRRRLAAVVITLALSLLAELVLVNDPLAHGSAGAAGPEVSEVRDDGIWRDEERPGEPYEQLRGGADYVFRVRPGEAFSTIVSVRNTWPVPVILLGIDRAQQGTAYSSETSADWNGLGLLRDPTRILAGPGDVLPFHPVTLGPGEETVLVIAWIGDRCADPTAPLPPFEQGVVRFNPGLPLIYDVAGWRRTGYVYPTFDMTVPRRTGCATNPAPPA
jgi:hypothetical protein